MSVSGFGSRQFVSGSDYSDNDGYFSSRWGLYFRFGSGVAIVTTHNLETSVFLPPNLVHSSTLG
uniref:Uncharacterized protein n=1 Tax=Helianthus annuus TaxID=4232 RepID=A0A251UD63_HELAN